MEIISEQQKMLTNTNQLNIMLIYVVHSRQQLIMHIHNALG